MLKKKQIAVAIAAGTLATSLQSYGQDRTVTALQGDDFALEEVLVTARKKVENMQSVPIAIDALGEGLLAQLRVDTFFPSCTRGTCGR